MLRTYEGSCHCGSVRFEADLDLTKTSYRCNCSYCRKVRNWVTPSTPAQFRLMSGEHSITHYQMPDTGVGHYGFCSHCGVRLYTKGNHHRLGEFLNLFVVTLDTASEQELAEMPVEWIDGWNDIWDAAPAETRHL